jgi:hypothetical protein
MLPSRKQVKKIIETVDAGLVRGLGIPFPGRMCVEAAVCYALGLEHGDDPECVDYTIMLLKIALNDSTWSSNASRAKGLRKLAVLQLGTITDFDSKLFAKKVSVLSMKYAKQINPDDNSMAVYEAGRSAAYATDDYRLDLAIKKAVGSVRYSAKFVAAFIKDVTWPLESGRLAHDKVLADFAEDVARILIEMKVPAVKYLPLLD